MSFQNSPDDILVRPLTSADVSKVQDLHSRVMPITYPPSFFLQLLVMRNRACLVAYQRAQPEHPIAFISAAVQQPMSIHNRLSLKSPIASPLFPSSPRSKPFPGFDSNQSRLEILTLGVLPSYQHRGLARRLIQCIVEKFTCPITKVPSLIGGTLVYANVSTTNTSALRFYEQMGMCVLSEKIRDLYRTCSHGSKDAYLVVGIL